MLQTGDSENNVLTGGPDQDTLNGLGGDDTLIGNGNDDRLDGGDGDDTLLGGDGDDNLTGGRGNNFLDGGDGDDTISLGDGSDLSTVLRTSRGEDSVIALGLRNESSLSIIPADDAIRIVAFVDGVENITRVTTHFAFNESGRTKIFGINEPLQVASPTSLGGVEITGTPGDDIFLIAPGAEGRITVRPGAGAEEIRIMGEDGYVDLDYSDSTYGIFANLHFGLVSDVSFVSGFDEIIGDGRVHEVRGTEFSDEMFGSNQDDRFVLGAGFDFVAGRGGDDLVRYDLDGIEDLVVTLGQNRAVGTLNGEQFVHSLRSIEDIQGSDGGKDELNGSGKDNKLFGLGGNDQIYGRGGNDELYGGDGNDRIYGGSGDDMLNGGEGFDRFIFRDDSGNNIINDFDTDAREDIVLRLVTAITDFADLTANHLSETLVNVDGNDVLSTVIDDGAAMTITLLGVANADLAADDFIF